MRRLSIAKPLARVATRAASSQDATNVRVRRLTVVAVYCYSFLFVFVRSIRVPGNRQGGTPIYLVQGLLANRLNCVPRPIRQ